MSLLDALAQGLKAAGRLLLICLAWVTAGHTQEKAFRKYTENCGAWMSFHFAGFALTPSMGGRTGR